MITLTTNIYWLHFDTETPIAIVFSSVENALLRGEAIVVHGCREDSKSDSIESTCIAWRAVGLSSS